MIGVWDDDARTWYSVLDVSGPWLDVSGGPCGAARFIVFDQSSLPPCPVITQTVPVVRTGVDGESWNRDARILLHSKIHRGSDRRARRQWRHIHHCQVALMKNGLEPCASSLQFQLRGIVESEAGGSFKLQGSTAV